MNWRDIPESLVPRDYTPPEYPQSPAAHIRILNQLGFTDPDEIKMVVDKFESGLADPYNFPLMADDLRRLPPSYVQASEYDTLRDDALIFARRLQQSGTRVTLDYQQHGWHGNIFFAETLITTTSAINVHRNVTTFIRNMMN